MQQVTTVVNFGLPVDQDGEPDFETYLHRIGRAGRFGHRGIAFSVVEREAMELVHKIEEYFREYPHGSSALGGTVGTDPPPAHFLFTNGPCWAAPLPRAHLTGNRRQMQLLG